MIPVTHYRILEGWAKIINEQEGIGCYDGWWWPHFDCLAASCGLPEADTRRYVRAMRRDGWVYYSPLVDCDMIPCGSGYLLTLLGEKMADKITNKIEQPT